MNYFSQELVDKYAPEADCIPPMKIWKLPEHKEYMFPTVCKNGLYFAELKKDGYLYQYEKTENHQYLFSRTTSKKTGILSNKIDNVPHIAHALNLLPSGTIIVGEIYYPGKTSKDVTKIMGCLSKEAITRQEDNPIHFFIYDCIKYNGVDLMREGAFVRHSILKSIWEKYRLFEYPFMEFAEAIEENIEDFVIDALNHGEEGAVLKKRTAPYSPDKRPAWDTIKIKKVDELDVICTGFCDATMEYTGKEVETWSYWIYMKDGELPVRTIECMYGEENWIPVTKGYFYGWKTAIEVSVYNDKGTLVPIGTIASGLNDDLRADFAENPEKYLNRVCKIQCMELDNKEHTIRHGFFKGFRDDKNMNECTINSIFEC